MKTSMKFFMALAIVSICLSKCGGSSGEKSAKHSTQSEEMRIKQKIAEMAGEDDDLDEEESRRLDVNYVQNWSVLGDFVYVLRTIGVVIHPNGAY